MNALPYVDGWYGPERELTVVPRPQFPFKTSPLPDVYTRLYEREYKVYPRGYVPKIANRTAWTNLLTYSERFDQGAWTKVNVTVTPNSGTAPDGQQTLGTAFETATNAEHSLTQTAAVPAAPVEFSVFAAAGVGRSWIRLTFTDSAAVVFNAFFDITSGRVGTRSAGATAAIVAIGMGQFRCVLRLTPAAGTGTFKINLSTDGAAVSYAGNAALGVRLWGAQASAGTGAPYVSSTAATRSIFAPDHDKADPLAFLIEEQDPASETSETEIIRRAFCRVPRQQVVPSSMFITKPPLAGTFPAVVAGSLVMQPDPSVPTYLFYTRRSVTADTGKPAAAYYPTGGTYTLTIGADTTGAIAYNASAATVQTAIRALTNIATAGVASVTGSFDNVLYIYVFPEAFAGPIDPANIIGTGSTTSWQMQAMNQHSDYYWYNITSADPGVTRQITGGTFTVTFFGQTTAPIPYDVSTADLETAINALSKVGGRARVTIGSSYGATRPLQLNGYWIEFWIRLLPPIASINFAALTPAGASGSLVTLENGWELRFTAGLVTTRTITVPNHGISAGDTIIVQAGSGYTVLYPGGFEVLSSDLIRFTPSAPFFYTDDQIVLVGKQTSTTYTGGTKLTRTKRVTDFFLPGVTPGIATADDIPLPVYQGDAPSLLAAILAGETSINYEVGELVQWRDGPILARTITTLNAAAL